MGQPPVNADLDLRLVRYFTVVAQQLHFGRAAQQLHLAQPSLSRQIQRLEQQLGARLLDRTSQGTRLTEAGAVFLPQARALLRAAEQAAVRTRAAADPSRITIGYTAGLFVTPAVRELRRQHPEAEVHTAQLDFGDPRPALLDHRVDAVVARLPFRTEGLRVTVLYDEPRALAVSRGHRLAARGSVTLDDLADDPLPRLRDPAWNAFGQPDPRPDGDPTPDAAPVDDLEDKLDLIASGQALAIVARPPRVKSLRSDIVLVSLVGVEPCHVALATRADERNRLVSAFCKYAQGLLTGPYSGPEPESSEISEASGPES